MVRFGSRLSGSGSVCGVYTQRPPTCASRSKTTTECDSRRSSRAAASPAAPAPMTATWSEVILLHAGAIFGVRRSCLWSDDDNSGGLHWVYL